MLRTDRLLFRRGRKSSRRSFRYSRRDVTYLSGMRCDWIRSLASLDFELHSSARLISERDSSDADRLYVHDVAVLPEVRRRRSAERYVDLMEECACKIGVDFLVLVSVYNTQRLCSIRFGGHERLRARCANLRTDREVHDPESGFALASVAPNGHAITPPFHLRPNADCSACPRRQASVFEALPSPKIIERRR